MKKSSLGGTLLTLVILGTGAYLYRTNLHENYRTLHDLISPPQPCSEPIVYSLGTFDTQFGISKANFLKDINTAAQIWDTPFHRVFFVYVGVVSTTTGKSYGETAKNSLKINLLYDYRQDATNKMSGISSTISTGNAAYNALKLNYNSLVTTYTSQKAQLSTLVVQYDSQKAAYEQQVQYWNSRKGAPPEQYATLEQERQALNAQVDAINQAQNALNTLGNTVNSVVAELNSTAKSLNLNVTAYNTVGAATGSQFEEGEFVQDSTGRRINIYQYDNEDKLIRVLAHELGHALGLDHVQDPDAIMYALNEGAGGKLTPDDTTELSKVCGII